MSISDAACRTAAINPAADLAEAAQTAAFLGAVNGQKLEAEQLLASLAPNLGRNVNTTA